MSPSPTDRRVRRTRDLLRSALVSLIAEKGYDRITVQDILDRADVGRSTFYAHYRDKEDLLVSGFEDVRAALAAEAGRSAEHPGERPLLEPVVVVLRHVEEYRDTWGPLTRKGGVDVITRILHEQVAALVEAHLRSRFRTAADDRTQLDAAAHYVVGALMGLLVWWLDNDIPWSAEQLHTTFLRLATEGVERFVAGG